MRQLTESEQQTLNLLNQVETPAKPKNLTFLEKIFGVTSNYSHCKLCGDRLKRIGTVGFGVAVKNVYQCIDPECKHVESFVIRD